VQLMQMTLDMLCSNHLPALFGQTQYPLPNSASDASHGREDALSGARRVVAASMELYSSACLTSSSVITKPDKSGKSGSSSEESAILRFTPDKLLLG